MSQLPSRGDYLSAPIIHPHTLSSITFAGPPFRQLHITHRIDPTCGPRSSKSRECLPQSWLVPVAVWKTRPQTEFGRVYWNSKTSFRVSWTDHISWHETQAIYSCDFQPLPASQLKRLLPTTSEDEDKADKTPVIRQYRLATCGGDFKVRVSHPPESRAFIFPSTDPRSFGWSIRTFPL